VTRPFFVLGRGRSGTTLLARMLGGHPDACVAPEGFFVLNLRGRYGRGPWDAARKAAFCRDLLLERRMRTWGLDPSAVRAALDAQGETLTFPGACRAVYACYAAAAGRPGARLLGDKNPHYSLFAAELGRLFPAARFVHVVRDPRDNVRSFQEVPFDLQGTAALAYRWLRYNREVLRAAAAAPDRFLRVRFEDLVAAPEPELRRIAAFLELGWDPALLDFAASEPEGFYGAGQPWFEALRGPLDPGRAAARREAMPPGDARTVAAICGGLAAELGYPIEAGAGPTLTDRLGVLRGWGRVAAERALFRFAPPALRSAVINRHRRRSGRV